MSLSSIFASVLFPPRFIATVPLIAAFLLADTPAPIVIIWALLSAAAFTLTPELLGELILVPSI